MSEPRGLLILYGSETGTAEDVAETLARNAKRRHFNTRLMALDTYNISGMIQERLIIFVVSTTGQGDPPDNMKLFWRFILRKNLPSNSLSALQFAVIALGDSSYQKFNFIGKKLNKRLIQLGGQCIQDIGLADDQHDLGADAVVDVWSEQLWTALMSLYPLPPGLEIISKTIRPPPKYNVDLTEHTGVAPLIVKLPAAGSDPPSETRPFYATLLSNERVTSPDHWQDVRLIRLDIAGANISYDPGDVAMIQPENSEESVQEFLQLLHIHSKQVCELSENHPGMSLPPTLPQPFTVDYLVRHYLDINSVPRRSFFELLAYFTDSELEREKLEEFCTAEGQEELYTYCNRPRRTILEVLADFPHATPNIPLEYLLDLIPSLKPRAFSIASSQEAHGRVLEILMAVVEYKTKLHKPRRGVCSTWLASFNPASETDDIPVWVKKGTIHFPTVTDTPVIMVGPGTGVAPFRSFISHRAVSHATGNVLFFGCRNKCKDYHFQSEWEQHVTNNILQIYTAFSRDQEEREYVQDKMEEQASLLWKLLDEQQAWFLLAGNAKRMPDDVRAILQKIIQQEGRLTEHQAQQYIQNLDKCCRYQAETWS